MQETKRIDLPSFVQQITAQVKESTRNISTDTRVSGEIIIKIKLNRGGIMGACVSIDKLSLPILES